MSYSGIFVNLYKQVGPISMAMSTSIAIAIEDKENINSILSYTSLLDLSIKVA